MKPLICIYCEGSDTKLAVLEKEKDIVRVVRTASFDVVQPAYTMSDSLNSLSLDGPDMEFKEIEKESQLEDEGGLSSQGQINASLQGINLSNSLFIPALTEPAIYYHIFEGAKQSSSSKVTQEIITDIQQAKNVKIDKENLGYIELSDKSLLSVFLSGDVQCIKLINSLARFNGKRYYKIPSVKSADISLAYYVAKRKKFFPDDHSLIVYIGKEYSKLIFLHGRKLKHIGTPLDIGTINLHTYDVYFSKILLEMENGGIATLDNIVVCGEDDSENLILSFYGTFPEANISRLEFDDLDLSALKSDEKAAMSSFSVPIAAAFDYFDELDKSHKGINLLPKYVKEDQKVFQFAWHGYAILPLLFAAAFFITTLVLQNNQKEAELQEQIEQKTILQRQNQEILDQIGNLEGNINNFGQTQALLDTASAGTGVWRRVFGDMSNFFGSHKNIWLTRQTTENGKIVVEGYALSKRVLTDFAYSIKTAELKGIFFEELRDEKSYKFTVTFDLASYLSGGGDES